MAHSTGVASLSCEVGGISRTIGHNSNMHKDEAAVFLDAATPCVSSLSGKTVDDGNQC